MKKGGNDMEKELVDRLMKLFYDMGYRIDCNLSKEKNPVLEKLRQMKVNDVRKAMIDGIILEEKREDEFYFYNKIKVIDFENIEKNQFCIHQEIGDQFFRFDAMITINGIPVGLIEICEDIERGCLNLQKHMQLTSLSGDFEMVQLLVVMNQDTIQYKINCEDSMWQTWKVPNDEIVGWEEKVKLFFKKHTLLKWLKDYTFLNHGKTKIATYYQYWAAEKVIENPKTCNRMDVFLASGRTEALVLLLKQWQKGNHFRKTLVIVDRLEHQKDLYEKIKENISETIQIANSRMDLEDLLGANGSRIILTTYQKLRQYEKVYFGEIDILVDVLSTANQMFLEDLLKELFPKSKMVFYTNQSFPKEKLLYSYQMTDAIQDGNLTKVFYTARQCDKDTKWKDLEKEMEKKLPAFSVPSNQREQIILLTKKENVLPYMEHFGQNFLIATTSLHEKEEGQLVEDIIRENGSLERYRTESLEQFNEGKLSILLVTTRRELSEITSNHVTTVCLDRPIEEEMFKTILAILNRNNERKERLVLIDYAQNTIAIHEILERIEYQAIEEDMGKMIHEIRVMIGLLMEKQMDIEKEMERKKTLNAIYASSEIEIFLQKVKNLVERLFNIYSSYTTQELSHYLEEGEKKMFRERLYSFFETVDKICVIYAENITWEEVTKKTCKSMKIPLFHFTKIQESDVWKIEQLQGAWGGLSKWQKVEAIKNRLKRYGFAEKMLEALEKKEQKGQISEFEYEQKIEQLRQAFIQKRRKRQIPRNLKSYPFDGLLYSKLQDMSDGGRIQILDEKELSYLILEIRHQVQQEYISVGEQNDFLWKKIELRNIELIYDRMDKKVLCLSEEAMDEILTEIRKIVANEAENLIDEKPKKLYYIKKKNAYAVAEMRDGDFWVLKNSTTVEGISQGLTSTYVKQAKELRKKGMIKNNCFTEDCNLKSSSAAANIILGRNSNGKIEWKDREGRTLRENIEGF